MNNKAIRAAMLTVVLTLAVGIIPVRAFEWDAVPTSGGELTITFIGHASIMFEYQKKVIHVDPVGKETDYAKMPKADLILVTHSHQDHLDPDSLAQIRTEKTELVMSGDCSSQVKGGIILRNGDAITLVGLNIKAVPAYNLVHKRENGQPFHEKGVGNGYILTFGDKKIYVAGDTENTPEMKALTGIDIAFLPMNLPYTMTPAMVADAAKAFKPKILYPYHTGKTDLKELAPLMKDASGIEVRLRDMR